MQFWEYKGCILSVTHLRIPVALFDGRLSLRTCNRCNYSRENKILSTRTLDHGCYISVCSKCSAVIQMKTLAYIHAKMQLIYFRQKKEKGKKCNMKSIAILKRTRRQGKAVWTIYAVYLLSLYRDKGEQAAGGARQCLDTPRSAWSDPLESLPLGVKEDGCVLKR